MVDIVVELEKLPQRRKEGFKTRRLSLKSTILFANLTGVQQIKASVGKQNKACVTAHVA